MSEITTGPKKRTLTLFESDTLSLYFVEMTEEEQRDADIIELRL